ncbi:NB-ARC domain containing protein, partial [Parasponia andersonii]
WLQEEICVLLRIGFSECWVRKIGSVGGVLDDLVGLENAISVLEPLLLDAEKKAADDERIKDWLMGLEVGLYEGDNLLEELASEANTLSKQVRSCFCSTTLPVSQLNVHHKVKHISSRLLPGIEEEGREFVLEKLSDKEIRIPSRMEEDHWFEVGGGAVISTSDMDKMAIIEILLHREYESYGYKVVVLCLSGMKELETTRLAREVFNDERVTNHFLKRIWICLSNESLSNLETLQHVAACLGHRKMEETKEYYMRAKLIELLASSLSGVRYLIVLDGVLKETDLYCFLLEVFMGIGERGSRIIINTRADPHPVRATILPYCWGCPSEDHYWCLFEKMAFGFGGQLPKTNPSICRVKETPLFFILQHNT